MQWALFVYFLDSPSSSTTRSVHEVSGKLRLLQRKIDAEMQVRGGAERMVLLYRNTKGIADRRTLAQAEKLLADSNKTMDLLRLALQKYNTMRISITGSLSNESVAKRSSLILPKTTIHGTMMLRLLSIAVDKDPLAKHHYTYSVKVAGTAHEKIDHRRSDSSPEFTAKNVNEDFELILFNASELEIHVFEKGVLVGLAFIIFDENFNNNFESQFDLEPNGTVVVRWNLGLELQTHLLLVCINAFLQ